MEFIVMALLTLLFVVVYYWPGKAGTYTVPETAGLMLGIALLIFVPSLIVGAVAAVIHVYRRATDPAYNPERNDPQCRQFSDKDYDKLKDIEQRLADARRRREGK